ncbi:MAG: hypothetical protein CMJ78_16900 [Planctomycetaceae bacterium]|nr:hypothetical protein [Planctomycetaceae bacterium]
MAQFKTALSVTLLATLLITSAAIVGPLSQRFQRNAEVANAESVASNELDSSKADWDLFDTTATRQVGARSPVITSEEPFGFSDESEVIIAAEATPEALPVDSNDSGNNADSQTNVEAQPARRDRALELLAVAFQENQRQFEARLKDLHRELETLTQKQQQVAESQQSQKQQDQKRLEQLASEKSESLQQADREIASLKRKLQEHLKAFAASEQQRATLAEQLAQSNAQQSQSQDILIERHDAEFLSIQYHDVDIQEVLKELGRVSGLNILASSKVNGPASATLQNVTARQALEAIAKSRGYSIDDEESFLYVRAEPRKTSTGSVVEVLADVPPTETQLQLEDSTPEFTSTDAETKAANQMLMDVKVLKVSLVDAWSFGVDFSMLQRAIAGVHDLTSEIEKEGKSKRADSFHCASYSGDLEALIQTISKYGKAELITDTTVSLDKAELVKLPTGVATQKNSLLVQPDIDDDQTVELTIRTSREDSGRLKVTADLNDEVKQASYEVNGYPTLIVGLLLQKQAGRNLFSDISPRLYKLISNKKEQSTTLEKAELVYLLTPRGLR